MTFDEWADGRNHTPSIRALWQEAWDSAVEAAASVVDEWASAYPESVFPPVPEERKAKDGVAADLLREYLPRVAADIRERCS